MIQTKTKEDIHVKKWLDNYSLLKSMGDGELEDLNSLKDQAILQFGELGFPSTRHEEWKYTSVLPLLKGDFAGAYKGFAPAGAPEALLGEEEAHQLVLTNGIFNAEASSIHPEADGIFIGSLKNALKTHGAKVLAHFGHIAASETEAFTALNTAFTQDGVCVIVPRGKSLNRPVLIRNFVKGERTGAFANLRNLFIFEDRSEGSIIESFHSLGDFPTWTNRISEYFVGDEANISLLTLQNDREDAHLINQTVVQEGKQSNFSAVTLSLDGGIVRNNLTIRMNGEHSEAHMYGLYLIDGQSHVDNHTLVDHAVPNCFSNELYKGVMEDNSTGVFNGKIIVRPDAQKTNAFQSNKNVLLSEGATINTKPQLEIFADDVKCSHGATTGRLDEEALFYIRSRGIGEEDARALLTFAFASEIATFIKNETIREKVEKLISDRLYN